MVRHVHQDRLDRYYTLPDVVKTCLASVKLSGFPVVVEPSAGSGSFSSLIKGCTALDIAPTAPGIIEADFLTWEPPEARPIAVVGNPPYGVNGAGVSAFIRKACSFADMVAFILPLSYERPSMHARWPRHFHLVHSLRLPTPNAELDGVPAQTRNVWQVWERRNYLRVPVPIPVSVGWSKCKRAEATHAMRTHGNGVGRLSDPATANASSHVFFAVEGAVRTERMGAILEEWDWPDSNMGQPSVGARDYVPAINEAVRRSRTRKVA